jgi:hypothetical protein
MKYTGGDKPRPYEENSGFRFGFRRGGVYPHPHFAYLGSSGKWPAKKDGLIAGLAPGGQGFDHLAWPALDRWGANLPSPFQSSSS